MRSAPNSAEAPTAAGTPRKPDDGEASSAGQREARTMPVVGSISRKPAEGKSSIRLGGPSLALTAGLDLHLFSLLSSVRWLTITPSGGRSRSPAGTQFPSTLFDSPRVIEDQMKLSTKWQRPGEAVRSIEESVALCSATLGRMGRGGGSPGFGCLNSGEVRSDRRCCRRDTGREDVYDSANMTITVMASSAFPSKQAAFSPNGHYAT